MVIGPGMLAKHYHNGSVVLTGKISRATPTAVECAEVAMPHVGPTGPTLLLAWVETRALRIVEWF